LGCNPDFRNCTDRPNAEAFRLEWLGLRSQGTTNSDLQVSDPLTFLSSGTTTRNMVVTTSSMFEPFDLCVGPGYKISAHMFTVLRGE
jgi:hypothetical protein